MTHRAHRSVALLASAALLAAGAAPATAATPTGPAAGQRIAPCFFISQWKGWTSPSENILYLGVSPNRVYEVTLSVGSPFLNDPTSHLISKVVGSSSICTSLDLQLYLSNGHGIESPLIAVGLRQMSAAEVAAIPPKYRPSML